MRGPLDGVRVIDLTTVGGPPPEPAKLARGRGPADDLTAEGIKTTARSPPSAASSAWIRGAPRWHEWSGSASAARYPHLPARTESAAPSVVARRRDAEHACHGGNGEHGLVRAHELK